jgi:predicted membrane chloride channel (bestrophin family)
MSQDCARFWRGNKAWLMAHSRSYAREIVVLQFALQSLAGTAEDLRGAGAVAIDFRRVVI